jgi:hypothetical protein
MPNAPLKIFTTAEWGAVPPSAPVTITGERPTQVVVHHTEGHAPNLDHRPTQTKDEAFAYARALQRDHMSRVTSDGRHWIDTGHNFLVTRGGFILEGRHRSLGAIVQGTTVVGAHANDRFGNHQPGIEHEQMGDEPLTEVQKQASVRLHAFICRHTGIRPSNFFPHHHFSSTTCPGSVVERFIPELKRRVAQELAADQT